MSGLLPLFTLRLRHGFFAPGPWRGLQLQPSGASAERARLASVWLRRTDDGLAGFVDADRADALWRRCQAADPDAPWHLLLLARSTDAQLSRYTDGLDTSGCATLLLDSGQAGAPDNGGWRTLHTGDHAGPAQLASLGADALDELQPAEGLPPPLLVLRLAPITAAAATPAASAPTLADWLAAQHSARYTATLAARATRWTYLLPADWADQQPEVVDLDGHTEFDDPRSVQLADGRRLLAVASRSAIAFSDRPVQRHQLRARAPLADEVLVPQLPAANAAFDCLARDTASGALVSEIPVRR